MKSIDKTNEKLTKLFRNNFELAMYAIEIARRHVRSGKEFSLTQILKEVVTHPMKGNIEDLIREVAEEQAAIDQEELESDEQS